MSCSPDSYSAQILFPSTNFTETQWEGALCRSTFPHVDHPVLTKHTLNRIGKDKILQEPLRKGIAFLVLILRASWVTTVGSRTPRRLRRDAQKDVPNQAMRPSWHDPQKRGSLFAECWHGRNFGNPRKLGKEASSEGGVSSIEQ